jgi:methenyltetrahydrofolate cyclohydrolase
MHADMPLGAWLDALAAGTPSPAGGAALGVAGSLAAALAAMAARLTAGRPKYAAVEGEFVGIVTEADALRRELLVLAGDDAEAYEGVTRARALPQTTDAERAERRAAVAKALLAAATPPLAMLRAAARAAELAQRAVAHGNASAAPDAQVGVHLAHAVARGAYDTVIVNLDAAERLGTPAAETAPIRQTAIALLPV